MRFTLPRLQSLSSTVRHASVATTPTSRAKSIAFIGLGRMGSEMAYNLFSKQYAKASDARFYVCDVVPESINAFTENFARQFPGAQLGVLKSPKDAAEVSQTIVTMLPGSANVNAVYTDLAEQFRALPQEMVQATLCIDSTTHSVETAKTVSQQIHDTGAVIVDAPVSGGVTGAKAGTLAFLVGGTPHAYTLASPFLSLMGQRLIYCGPAGAGLAAKICNNLILGCQQVAVAEGMLLGQRLGLSPSVLANVINSSTGRCWSSEVNNPVMGALEGRAPPCERGYDGGFATSLMHKDMLLAEESASGTGTPLRLATLARRIYEDAIAVEPRYARKDFSSVYEYYVKGVGLKGDPAPEGPAKAQ